MLIINHSLYCGNIFFEKMKKNKTYVIVLIVILTVILLSFLGIYKCPINYIFGIPCLTCGMTRALYYAITLNFNKAFYYHLLWPLIIIAFILYILIELNIIKLNKKTKKSLIYLITIIFVVYYIIRHINNSPIVKINFDKSLIHRIYNYIIK